MYNNLIKKWSLILIKWIKKIKKNKNSNKPITADLDRFCSANTLDFLSRLFVNFLMLVSNRTVSLSVIKFSADFDLCLCSTILSKSLWFSLSRLILCLFGRSGSIYISGSIIPSELRQNTNQSSKIERIFFWVTNRSFITGMSL